MDAMTSMAAVLTKPPPTKAQKRAAINRDYYQRHRDQWRQFYLPLSALTRYIALFKGASHANH